MGRKQHQKDKSYISRSEWEEDFGGFKRKVSSESEKALPFDHCSLTLSPFTNPVCSPEGHVFDLEAIIPYLEKNENKNPINGAYLNSKDLIRLHFSKSEHSGRLQCPITLKEFNSHSHIVAIKQTGNVFLYETLKKFAKDSRGEYADPLDQKRAFNWPTDLIEIQNPKDLTNRYLENFEFLKKKDKESSDFSRKRATSSIESDSQTQLQVSDSARLEMYEKMKSPKFPSKNKKGLVTLETNLGHIDLILDCDLVPQTCHNFLTLCERGYYNDINFHRLIPGFMVQGGDPKGDGTGGKGAFNDTFPDEFHSSLQHDSRGIISMANRGKNTNSSQFFITFGPARHLDQKHSVFGHIFDNAKVLDKIESSPVGENDRPMIDIKILSTPVQYNPFELLESKASSSSLSDNARGLLEYWKKSSQSASEKDKPSKPSKKPRIGKYIRK